MKLPQAMNTPHPRMFDAASLAAVLLSVPVVRAADQNVPAGGLVDVPWTTPGVTTS